MDIVSFLQRSAAIFDLVSFNETKVELKERMCMMKEYEWF